jgi:monothiol glutaredoxin
MEYTHSFSTPLDATSNDVQEKIRQIVAANPVVIFMKGSLSFPACRFSALAVQILKTSGLSNQQIHAINVLEDNEIREGVKIFSDWPTIPQIYIQQEFIGGSDILLNLYESGDLTKILAPVVNQTSSI